MRRVLVLLLLAATVATVPARADRKKDKQAEAEKAKDSKPAPAPPSPRTPGPDDAKVTSALDKIVAGPDRAAREAAIKELTTLAPNAIDAIAEWLARPHTASIEDRRAVLREIKAQVPDKTGKFNTPERQNAKERKADDDLDWQPKLLELDAALPGLGEVIADDAAIRALAATKDIRAAKPIFDAAFLEETMLYRDECGRYLRKMEPYSIPLLTKESTARNYDRKRYGTFQLERLDRQEPGKALASAAGNEALTIAILETFQSTKLREAVHAVWTKVNDDAPRVRAAGRAAFMDYITGPPPPPAPKKKLQLPGGKLTKKEKPMYLTYRELADNELRTAANDLLHEDYPLDDPTLDDYDRPNKTVKVDQVELAKRLFEYYDNDRRQKDGAQWAAAKAKADAGDLATATQMLDRLLATNPQRGEREGMALIYAQWGKQLEELKKWPEAAAAYSKAHGLDPKGKGAIHALAAHHFAAGKALEAQGKDGGPDFRKAVALEPDFESSASESSSSGIGSSGKRPVWMLYAAIVAGGLAMLLFAAAMVRRRAA
jgi:tetratricopeptide (TPR) repeat protein